MILYAENKDMRVNKDITVDIETLKKNKISKSLRFED